MRFAVGVALLAFASTAHAGTSHPTGWSGSFTNPPGVTAASGNSRASITSTCGSPTSGIHTETWGGFPATAPDPAKPPPTLDITWELEGYVGKGHVYLDIDYTLDGSVWHSAVSASHLTGGSFSTVVTTTTVNVPPSRILPGNIGNIEVAATLMVFENCGGGSVGSYYGKVKVHELVINN